jgi:hypothetical protein
MAERNTHEYEDCRPDSFCWENVEEEEQESQLCKTDRYEVASLRGIDQLVRSAYVGSTGASVRLTCKTLIILAVSTVHVSFPNPRPGVISCKTVKGIENNQAAIAHASSHLQWPERNATVERTIIARSARTPETIETHNNLSVLSRIGAPHIVCVVLTATIRVRV